MYCVTILEIVQLQDISSCLNMYLCQWKIIVKWKNQYHVSIVWNLWILQKWKDIFVFRLNLPIYNLLRLLLLNRLDLKQPSWNLLSLSVFKVYHTLTHSHTHTDNIGRRISRGSLYSTCIRRMAPSHTHKTPKKNYCFVATRSDESLCDLSSDRQF